MPASIPSIQVLIASHEERHAPKLPRPLLRARNCNQCGQEHYGYKGVGGSTAREGDLEMFPFNPALGTGVQAENAHWMHGAFCSDECYDAAYYEPPTSY